MTDRLAEIAARLAKITPGPWRISMSGYSVKSSTDAMPIVASNPWGATMSKDSQIVPWLDNAEFIAHAPQDIRDLLALVQSQAEQIARLEGERDAAQHRLMKVTDYAVPMYQNLVAYSRRKRDAAEQRIARLEGALREIASRPICEDKPDACHLDSGPYCGAHTYDEDLVLVARVALAATPEDQ